MNAEAQKMTLVQRNHTTNNTDREARYLLMRFTQYLYISGPGHGYKHTTAAPHRNRQIETTPDVSKTSKSITLRLILHIKHKTEKKIMAISFRFI